MKILLFGGSGQLGFELIKRASALNFEIASPVKQEVNVSNKEQVLFLAKQIKPDVIVNSAAYTAVDKAETEPEKAYLINRDGALHAALAAKASGSKLIHISTDYVFDGAGNESLSENSPVNPINIYGKSKLAGEQAVQEVLGERALVVRTSWLHGKHGTNFVQTMLRLFKEQEELKVVRDQIGCPTWAGWLAEVVLDLTRLDVGGVLHAANSGQASWFDFANAILEFVKPSLPGLKVKQIQSQTSQQLQRPAPRPKFSVLNCSRLQKLLGRDLMSWQEGLKNHLRDLEILGA